MLFEGAQGALLEIDHGTYPCVTSSSTTAVGAGVGIAPTRISGILGAAGIDRVLAHRDQM